MAYDEDGYYKDEQAQAQFKGVMSEALGAAVEGRYSLMPKTFRNHISKGLDGYNNNTLDLNTHPHKKHSKTAALKPVVMFALMKAAKRQGITKEANWWQNFQNQAGNYAGQGWGKMFGQDGMMQNAPGQPWMYGTGAGALGGYLLGQRFNNPWAGALMGGGLGYLLNNWGKEQYGKQNPAAPAPAPGQPPAPEVQPGVPPLPPVDGLTGPTKITKTIEEPAAPPEKPLPTANLNTPMNR